MNATVRYDRAPAPKGETPAALANNGWSHDERVAAIEEILNRHGKPLNGPDRDELASKSNLYLEARVEAGRSYEKRSGEADERSALRITRQAKSLVAAETDDKIEAEVQRLKAAGNSDADDGGLAAYIAGSRTGGGYGYLGNGYSAGVPGASRADAAGEDEAYRQSVENLNAWRKDAAAAHQPQDHGGLPPSVPGRTPTTVDVRGDAASEDEAYRQSVANLNAWREPAA